MTRHTFFCIDAHTCGNPVRVVVGRRAHRFPTSPWPEAADLHRRDHDWVRARADVRAARPRRDVRHDPLPADARGLRRRRALHRGERLPADVRPRHDRHRHRRDRGGPGPAASRKAASRSKRRPAGSRPITSGTGRFVEQVRHLQRRRATCTPPTSSSMCRASAALESTSPMAATTTRSSSRRRTGPDLDGDAGRRHPAAEPARCAARRRRRSRRVHPEDDRIRGVSHVMWCDKPRDPRARCAQRRLLRRQGRSTARPAAPGHRRAWPSSSARGSSAVGDDFVPREHHRHAVRLPRREPRRRVGQPSPPSCRASRAGRVSPATTRSMSTTATRSPTASSSPKPPILAWFG